MTTWSNSNKSSDITLTGSGLIATVTGNSAGWKGVKISAPVTDRYAYCEVLIGAGLQTEIVVGVAPSGYPLACNFPKIYKSSTLSAATGDNATSVYISSIEDWPETGNAVIYDSSNNIDFISWGSRGASILFPQYNNYSTYDYSVRAHNINSKIFPLSDFAASPYHKMFASGYCGVGHLWKTTGGPNDNTSSPTSISGTVGATFPGYAGTTIPAYGATSEIWTLTFSDTTTFTVSGSVSGAKGTFHTTDSEVAVPNAAGGFHWRVAGSAFVCTSTGTVLFTTAEYKPLLFTAGGNGFPAYTDLHKYADIGWGDSFQTGDVISIAVDTIHGDVWFAKNGTWQKSGNPGSALNPALSGIVDDGSVDICVYMRTLGNSVTLNTGKTSFAYSLPTNFSPLDNVLYDYNISGVLTKLTNPIDRSVLLLDRTDTIIVGAVTSDAVTGAYSFPNVRGDRTYTILGLPSDAEVNSNTQAIDHAVPIPN
jgi:hypothetical protein